MRQVLVVVGATLLLAGGCRDLVSYERAKAQPQDLGRDTAADGAVVHDGGALDLSPADVVAGDAAGDAAGPDAPLADGTVADVAVVDLEPQGDSTVDTLSPDSTVDTVAPDSTVDTLSPDSTMDTVAPDSTVDTVAPDSTVDTLAPDTTVDTLSPDSTVDAGGTVSISGTIALANNITCGSTEADDCRGRLFVGAYSPKFGPFQPANLVSFWLSPTVVDLKTKSVDFRIDNLPPNATYWVWPYLAEVPSAYVESDPVNGDLTPLNVDGTGVQDQDVTMPSAIELNWRWVGG